MIIQSVLFALGLWFCYSLGYTSGKKTGWALAKRLPYVRHFSALDS